MAVSKEGYGENYKGVCIRVEVMVLYHKRCYVMKGKPWVGTCRNGVPIRLSGEGACMGSSARRWLLYLPSFLLKVPTLFFGCQGTAH